MNDRFNEDISWEVEGQIDEAGLPSGIWVFRQKGGIEIVQKRLYLNGALVYVQEKDLSSGDRTLPYCAFSELKKAPSAEEIVSWSVDGIDTISCQGFTAHRVEYDIYSDKHVLGKCKLPMIGKLWSTELLEMLPESMWRYAASFYEIFGPPDDIWKGPEPLADQYREWLVYYTDRK